MSAKNRYRSLEKNALGAVQKLAIISGGGSLPESIASACDDQGIDYLVIGLKGSIEEAFQNKYQAKLYSAGQLGKIFNFVRRQGVTHVICVGSIARPSFKSLRLDFYTFRKLLKLGFRVGGDNSVLEKIYGWIIDEGFKPIGAHEIAPELLIAGGNLTKLSLSSKQKKDIERGFEVAHKLGELDIGQSVVIQEDLVLGVEAIEGTDALIGRTALLKRKKAEKPILIKAFKPGQNEAMDMPTIGFQTVQKVKEAGFAGIAVSAGKTILLDAEDVVKFADENDLFVVGM